jgi:hypothetical protein
MDSSETVTVVSISDLDEWYEVSLKCSFLGNPEFQVAREWADRYWIDYTGGDGPWVTRAWQEGRERYPQVGFQQLDRYTFSATAPKDMVDNVHEERRNLLMRWRERQERERPSY